MYDVAKSGDWDRVLSKMSRDPTLAATCSRYVKPTSGWTFLHQAAYFDHDPAVRALVGLGSALDARSQDGQTPIDVAERRGHQGLTQSMRDAVPDELWKPHASPDVRPSSNVWREAEPRRTQLGLMVGYGGKAIQIPPGSRYYVDSFERILIGFHGMFDPPLDMGSYPCIDIATMARRLGAGLPESRITSRKACCRSLGSLMKPKRSAPSSCRSRIATSGMGSHAT